MTVNSDHVKKASDLKVSAIHISEPKTPIYVSKEAAFNYVKQELQEVENVRKAGIEEIETAIWDASQNADNHYATLDQLSKAHKKHEVVKLVVFVGVVGALSGFAAHSFFQWFFRKLMKTLGKKKLNDGASEIKLDREGGEDLQGDNLKIRSGRLHSRNWQVTIK